MPLTEIVAFAAAIALSGVVSDLLAGMLGIGGGAVLVPVFYQVFGLLDVPEAVRMHLAVGSSLAICACNPDGASDNAAGRSPGARTDKTSA